jgi:macrolide transport system ATP-binding/permease protein
MSLFRRISNLFSLSKVNQEIDAELESHLAMRIEDNLKAGMSPEQARRDALIRFGNPVTTKERVTDRDAALVLHSIWSDIRYACRQLWKNPGFACTAVLVLALGICASIAIFAFVDAVLIKPLPYRNPSRLIALFESTPLGPRFHLSYLDYLDWKRENKVFSAVEAYENNTFVLKTATGAQQADGAVVSDGFFRVLGVAPILGRDFHEGEDLPGTQRTVMLSYGAWQNRYGGRQAALGQTVMLDGFSNLIIGVLPRGFYFAPAGSAEFWTTLHASSNPDGRGEHGLSGIARLKDGMTLENASGNMSSIARLLAKQYPDSDEGRGATVMTLTEVIVGNLRPILLLLLSGALLLLLIACINVSSLLLVRSENRRREIAVRGALGASPARLIRQVVTESLVLVGVGNVVGLSAAYGAMHLLTRLIPTNMLADMPYLGDLGFSVHVMGFAAAIGLTTALLFSLTSVVRLSFSDLRAGLTEGGRSSAGTVWRHLGANLVVVELCTAMVLLAGAGLLTKSFYKLLHADIGLQPDHLATVVVTAPRDLYEKDEEVAALTHRVMSEVSRLPGVQSVAVTRSVPVADVAGGNTTFQIMGRPGHGEGNEANSRQVSGGYFSTLQARLLRGRYFSDEEDASKPLVAIINDVFAQKYFPGEDPIGREIRYDESEPWIRIVGQVANLREGPLDEAISPALYTPFDQTPHPNFVVVVRTVQAPQGILKSLVGTIGHIDPGLLTSGAETMVDRIDHSQSAYLHRSSAWLVGGFAGVALLLSVVGLYGVVAYSVSQRTREIGVRMALGAQRSSVYRLILKEAGWLTAAGVGTGLVCAVAAANVLRRLLFGTEPWDVVTLASVAAVLAVCAMLASYIPARRAASVNPVEALRAE